MTNRIFRPTYLIEELGEMGRLPDGAIVNIGGTAGPYFTVGGKALLFADGSATGTGLSGITLQNTYDNGLAASILTSIGRDLVFQSTDGHTFTFNATTGTVTISGDLNVLGASNVIEGTISNLDAVNIGLPDTTTTGFTLKPNVGVVPNVDLFQVSHLSIGTPDFRIDKTGNVIIGQNITLTGLINGVDITALATEINTHLDAAITPAKHAAQQISYNPGTNTQVLGTNVQAALDSIEVVLNTFIASEVRGFEYVQSVPVTTWMINHGLNSKRVQVSIWDSTDEQILADSVKIITVNSVQITFNTTTAGRAILMVF